MSDESIDVAFDGFEETIDLIILKREYEALLNRYDDALKRINDLEAELEYLRREVNRG